jgi:hypothetical protein
LENRFRGFPARTALGRAGPGNGKPKSYERFWALSSSLPIRYGGPRPGPINLL